MKRWMLLLALGMLLLWQPFSASDVAQLKPVEVIRVTAAPNGVLVETDTGETGLGK